jgi:tetratricopeptide (TPR) repeat protein
VTVPAKPNNLPDVSLRTLFKGRDAFLDDLQRRLGAGDGRPAAIVAHQAVHGLGGVGKTRAAIEYAWRFRDDYTALLFVPAPSAAELRAKLADLVGVFAIATAETAVEPRLGAVLSWLDAHPGWLLILDNIDTEEAAREVHQLLAQLRAGHVLITSRIANWRAGIEPVELHVLAQADAVAFLLERTTHRPQRPDDDARAAEIARELDGLALALEQAGAYIDKLRLSFAEYLVRWHAKRAEVLKWHDEQVMGYPVSVAVTWETTFAQLEEPERRLLEVLAWLAPEPIPLFLFGTEPLTSAVPEARDRLAGLTGYSLAGFAPEGDTVEVHRLVQEVTRGRVPETDRTATLQVALEAVNELAPYEVSDVRTWAVWTPLAAHADAVIRYADADGIAEPTARLMSQLGVYRLSRGQFRDAEPLFRRALAIGEQNLGLDDPNVASVLNNLAFLLRDTNRLDEAEPLFRRALAIDERSYGPDHPKIARDLNNLAMLIQVTNRLDEAEPLFRRALAIDERCYGLDHPKIARDLNNLALLLQATNRLAEAEPLFRRALAINERSYGLDHPRVATALNNLALLLRATNRLAEAESLFRRALAIDERSYGPDHPDVARDLNNLALLLQTTNRPDEAEPLIRRALAIDERSYGPDHPNVAIDLNNLAELLQATNRLDEAEPLVRRALAIDERSYGPDHPDVARDLNNLAELLRAANRLAEAEPLYYRAVEILEASLGFDHPNVAATINNLAGLLRDTNRLSEANPFYRRALAIWEQSLGPDHPTVATALNNLAVLLRATNRLDEAEPMMCRALAIDERSYGPDHPDVARDLSNLAMLLQATNRLDEAEPMMRRAMQILIRFQRRTGHEHPNFRRALVNDAVLMKALGKTPQQVEQHWRELYESLRPEGP